MSTTETKGERERGWDQREGEIERERGVGVREFEFEFEFEFIFILQRLQIRQDASFHLAVNTELQPKYNKKYLSNY